MIYAWLWMTYQYFCKYCGAGPYGEQDLYSHMASAHPTYPN